MYLAILFNFMTIINILGSTGIIGGKTLKPETYYTVKVFFRNSAGDGGVTEDTVKTLADG